MLARAKILTDIPRQHPFEAGAITVSLCAPHKEVLVPKVTLLPGGTLETPIHSNSGLDHWLPSTPYL